MNNFAIFIGVYLFSVFISSCSQIILKKSTRVKHDNVLLEYINPQVITAYAIFFGATLVTVFALKYIPVSLGAVLESAGYIFVTVLGRIFLKEYISHKKLAGITVILVGILVYSL